MADEKVIESAANAEPTAPLFTSIQANDEMAPPPPYSDPLLPLNASPQQANPMINPPIYSNVQPSAVYLAPIDYQSKLGSSPTRLKCPNCSAEIVTQTKFTSGCMTWAICGSICAIGLFVPCAWLGCQLLPFCVDSCKDVRHSCPNCRQYIGTFDRLK